MRSKLTALALFTGVATAAHPVSAQEMQPFAVVADVPAPAASAAPVATSPGVVPAPTPTPPRPRPRAASFEARLVGSVVLMTSSGNFGPAASRWGYAGLYGIGAAIIPPSQPNLGVAASWSPNDYLRVGGRLLFGGIDMGTAWYDGARLTSFNTVLAPDIEARIPLAWQTMGFARRAELLFRGTFGLQLGRTDLRGETHVGAGYHAGLSLGVAGGIGPVLLTFEGGYSWNLWDSGGPVPVQFNGVDFQLGIGYRQ